MSLLVLGAAVAVDGTRDPGQSQLANNLGTLVVLSAKLRRDALPLVYQRVKTAFYSGMTTLLPSNLSVANVIGSLKVITSL